ncbi:hypothetical protein MOQ_005689 [Trypanosoma cruzi marinkellei]|uniref:Uncharacterized protein n=1 Tax=Trypanosoma cruzi marinkellei TaxID=85056 RepID=K2MXH5_TRYCR|nr:hypothetical protein MOQ_005689 [Trypanosoma cruzi marinkellei]
MAKPPVAEAAATTAPLAACASCQRLCGVLDEVARKDSALQQFRALFEKMSRDYEVEQRNAAQAKLELAALTTRHETQQQELIAVKAKSAMQESRIKEEDDAWERRTRQLRQELAAAVDERDALASEREVQWQEARALRSRLEEQQRQLTGMEDAWKCRLEETRREAEEKVRSGMREREELLRLREVELQRSTSQLEGRLTDMAAEQRRQQDASEALMLRIEDLQRSLRRQETMTQRAQDALSVEQKEKAQLGEYMALERQTYRQRQEQTETSYKAQLQEMERVCDQHVRERERLESEIARCQRESQQEAQRAREVWMQEKQQLEATIESLRGELTREHMRFDKAHESHQRVEALLVRTRRELEASQHQEAVLQETITSLQKAAAKRDATHLRLEGEITRLSASVAERERDAERWRSAMDRMEWQTRLEAARDAREHERVFPEALPPPPPLPLSTSSAPRRDTTRRSAWVTPNGRWQQAESIEHTPLTGSPSMKGTDYPPRGDEDRDADMLRSIVQEVLQECVTRTEPSSSSLTHASNSAALHPVAAATGDRHLRTPRRRTTSSRARRHAKNGDSHLGEDLLRNGMPSASPITRSTPPRDVPTTKIRASMALAPTRMSASTPSMATSTNSSILQAAAPLFTSTADNSYLDSSTVSQPQRNLPSRDDRRDAASRLSVGSPLAVPVERCSADADSAAATAALIQKYTREREENEQRIRQTLRDLEQRQRRLLYSVEGGVDATNNTDAPPTRREGRNGDGVKMHNISHASSAAASSSSLATAHISSRSSSARASTAAPAPPSRLLLLQERFATMPIIQ